MRCAPSSTLPRLNGDEAARIMIDDIMHVHSFWPKELPFPDFFIRSTIARESYLYGSRQTIVHDEGFVDVSVALAESLLYGASATTAHVIYSFLAENLVYRRRSDLASVLASFVYDDTSKLNKFFNIHGADNRLFQEIYRREHERDFLETVSRSVYNGHFHRVGRLFHICHELGHFLYNYPRSVMYFRKFLNLPEFLIDDEECFADVIAVAFTLRALSNQIDFYSLEMKSIIIGICTTMIRIIHSFTQIDLVVRKFAADVKEVDSEFIDLFDRSDYRLAIVFGAICDDEVIPRILKWSTGDFVKLDNKLIDHFYWYAGVISGASALNVYHMINNTKRIIQSMSTHDLQEIRRIDLTCEVDDILTLFRSRMGDSVRRTISPHSILLKTLTSTLPRKYSKKQMSKIKVDTNEAGVYIHASVLSL